MAILATIDWKFQTLLSTLFTTDKLLVMSMYIRY
jgi:hypothetical protein